jgi:hypothetical protein
VVRLEGIRKEGIGRKAKSKKIEKKIS